LIEGVVVLARLLACYEFSVIADKTPVPVAHLTVRARDGIWLRISARKVG